MWPRAKSASRVGLNSFLWGWSDRQPVGDANGATTQVGARALWPTTLDRECDKAARILRSFCKDGFYEADEEEEDERGEHVVDAPPDDAMGGDDINGSSTKEDDGSSSAPLPPPLPPRRQRLPPRGRGRLRRIPVEVVRAAKGLAIFTTMRAGLWVAGAGGSGVVVARQSDGSWTAPSAILLRTERVSFLVGIDVYDCVIVLNTSEAVAAFLQARFTLGSSTLVTVAGPLDGELVAPDTLAAPAFAYLKSRGVRARVPLTGTIVEQRRDENARFYGARRGAGAADVLLGVRVSAAPPAETAPLRATLKAAQGDFDIDPQMVPVDAAPSDCDVADGHVFGVPDRADPDPYGFLALEKEGLAVREAGTRRKASRDSFHFAPAPSSPLFGAFRRDGDDGPGAGSGSSQRSSWRASMLSTGGMTDTATQTDSGDGQGQSDGPPPLPSRPGSSVLRASMSSIPEFAQGAAPPTSSIATRLSVPPPVKPAPPPLPARPGSTITPPMTPTASVLSSSAAAGDRSPVSPISAGSDADDEDDGYDDEYDDGYDDDGTPIEIVALPVATATAAAPVTMHHQPRLVTVVKPPPPALPPRNPVRARRAASPGTATTAMQSPPAAAAPGAPTTAPAAPAPTPAPAGPKDGGSHGYGLGVPGYGGGGDWAADEGARQRAESASSSVYSSAHGRGGGTVAAATVVMGDGPVSREQQGNAAAKGLTGNMAGLAI